MEKITFEINDPVLYKKKSFLIKAPLNLTEVLIVNVENGETLVANICDLKAHHLPLQTPSFEKSTFLTISNLNWDEAKRREAVIKPLCQLATCPSSLAKQAAKQLNLSVRQIYTWISRY